MPEVNGEPAGLTTIDRTELAHELRTLIESGDGKLTVRTDDEAQWITGYRVQLRSAVERIHDFCDPNIARLHDAHKAAIRDRDMLTTPVANRLRIVDRALAEYEQARRTEVARLEAELARTARKLEEDRRLAEAERLEAQGQPEAAQALLEAPIVVVAPKIERTRPEGLSFRSHWTFTITDAALLPREYMMPDEKKIGEVVRAMKNLTNIPGVAVEERQVPVTRS